MRRFALAMLSLLVPALAHGEAIGVDSRQEFPPLGCGDAATGEESGCHFTNANAAMLVTIAGPDRIDVGEEGFGLYTASVPTNFQGREGAGINVALDAPNAPGCELEQFAPAGKIAPINESEDPADPVLSHRYVGDPPPITLVGVWSYQFLVLNCQAPGAVLLRVAMNAFDGSGDEEGEVWNFATRQVAVPEPVGSATAAAALASLAALARRTL